MKTNSTLKRSVKKHVLIMIMNMMKHPMKTWIIKERKNPKEEKNQSLPKEPRTKRQMTKRRARMRTVQNYQG